MKKYLLQVKNVLIIPKSYIQDDLTQYQGSKGHSATSDEGPQTLRIRNPGTPPSGSPWIAMCPQHLPTWEPNKNLFLSSSSMISSNENRIPHSTLLPRMYINFFLGGTAELACWMFWVCNPSVCWGGKTILFRCYFPAETWDPANLLPSVSINLSLSLFDTGAYSGPCPQAWIGPFWHSIW